MSELQLGQKRINKSLNVLKFLAVFAVICIHCRLSPLGFKGVVIDSLSRFAVPVFFLISGFYSYYDNNEKAINKYKIRIKRLLILLIIANVAYFIFNCCLYGDDVFTSLIGKFTIFKCYKYLIFNVSPTSPQLWFIQALIYCYVLFLIMSKFNINHKKLYTYIPLLLLGAIFIGEFSSIIGLNINNFFYRNFLFMGLPFFTLGFLIHDKENEFRNISDKIIYISIILSCCLIILEALTVSKCELYIGTIFLSTMLFVWCIKYPDKLDLKITGWIGGNLYTLIYVFHLMIILYLKNKHENLFNDLGYLNPFLILIISIFVSLIIWGLLKFVQKINTSFKNIN